MNVFSGAGPTLSRRLSLQGLLIGTIHSIGVAPQATVLYLKGVLFCAHLVFHFISQLGVLKGRKGMALIPFQTRRKDLIHFSKL